MGAHDDPGSVMTMAGLPLQFAICAVLIARAGCVLNLLFLVVVGALQRHQPMYRGASATHLLSAGFAW